MDYSAGSYYSSWPVNSASESYSFADASVEPYAVEGSVPPSSYFMRTTSDHNLTFSELERNSTVLSNGCLPYDAQADLLSSEILSKDKLPNSLLELQQLQNNSKRQSNVVTPGVLQRNSPPGIFRSQLDTAGLAELPHTLSSSIDSNGSEVSAFLPDVHAVSSESTLCSTFENGSSFMEPVNLGGFSFEEAQKDVILNKTGHPNGNVSVFDNAAALASLQDSKDFIGGSLSSFATVQERNLTGSGFRPQKQEQNAVCNIPVPTFMPHNQMAVTEAQGAQIPPKISSTVHSSKNECPVSHSSDVLARANSANGNGDGVKPRVRARRGQATDPHSIAERLRREKISERMKSLQDLVPNSNKADKSSMLDEIIDYVKFLQLQVKVLSMSRLGAPGAVLPLLAESQTEARSNQSQSASTITQGLVDIQDDSEDSIVFEEEVVKLMETSITNAMQYLQNKGLCLMPIALASAISTQKGVAGAAIPHER